MADPDRTHAPGPNGQPDARTDGRPGAMARARRTPRWLGRGIGPRLALGAMVAMAGALAAGGAASVAAAPLRPVEAAATMSHSRVLSYPIAQVWPAALRYLRVDRGFALVDRDREAGYILFDIPLSGSSSEETSGRGSLEMVETTDASGRPSVSVQISTDAGPSYLPHAIGEGLAAKLKRERGQPAPPNAPGPPKSPPPKDEGGADDPDDGSPPMLPPAVDPSEL